MVVNCLDFWNKLSFLSFTATSIEDDPFAFLEIQDIIDFTDVYVILSPSQATRGSKDNIQYVHNTAFTRENDEQEKQSR